MTSLNLRHRVHRRVQSRAQSRVPRRLATTAREARAAAVAKEVRRVLGRRVRAARLELTSSRLNESHLCLFACLFV
jgi:hypothetical protein